ncbi:MAG: hypothetical protein ACK6CT_00590 [Planctomycetia bacterium]
MERGDVDHRPGWLSSGDCCVVVTAAFLIVLGLLRHARSETDVAWPEPRSAASASCCGCPADCCGPLCHVLDPLGQDPLWSGRAEGLLLWRNAPQGMPLFNTYSGGAATGPALNAADFTSGMAAGPRFTLFRHTGDEAAIEFNFLRVQFFEARRVLPETDGGYQLADLDEGIFCCPSIVPLDAVSGGLSSGLQSFEINRRLPSAGRWQWLAGVRWVQWNERAAIDAAWLPIGAVAPRSGYATTTNNDLYGLQVGGDSILIGLGRSFRVEGLGKAGIFWNRAVQSSTHAYSGDPFQDAFVLANSRTVSRGAFVGEIGATAVYDVFDRLSLRAGYAAFWLGGLATASAQFDDQCLCPLDPIHAAIDTGGSMLVHGLTLGREARW